MPKSLFIRELKPNQVVKSLFLVQNKEIRTKKTGEEYLSLTFTDRTGALDAMMWDGVPEVRDAFDRDDFVEVKGLVQVHRNKMQMIVHTLHRLDGARVELADYLPHTDRNIDELWTELRAAVDEIGRASCRERV